MSDKITFELTVSNQDVEVAERILNEHLGFDDVTDNENGTTTFLFHDSKGTQLYGADAALVEAKVAWDMDWPHGDEFTKGTEYQRFTEDGECQRWTIYEYEEYLSLEQLQNMQKEGKSLEDAIAALEKRTAVTPLAVPEAA